VFIHTQTVIQKQKDKEKVEENGDEEDEEGIEVDEDDCYGYTELDIKTLEFLSIFPPFAIPSSISFY